MKARHRDEDTHVPVFPEPAGRFLRILQDKYLYPVMRASVYRVLCLVCGLFFIAGGAMHFLKPGFYLQISEGFLSGMLCWIYISGVAEILTGILFLLPATRHRAAFFTLCLMLAFLPLHIWHLWSDVMPLWAAFLRLVLQAGLILFFSYLYRHSVRKIPRSPAYKS
ncbi:MAG: hypothetical protein IBJ09_08060 [Bacteroidia bacterium]|nr:hypothetical protein [Bacteroidia bacterium]